MIALRTSGALAIFAVATSFTPAHSTVLGTEFNAHDCGAIIQGNGNVTFTSCGIDESVLIQLRADYQAKLTLEIATETQRVKSELQARIDDLVEENSGLRLQWSVATSELAAEPVYTQAAIVEARTAFNNKAYDDAAALARIAYRGSREALNKTAMAEMITASLFGAGRHRSGLEFICERYASLPRNDHRYRHDVHSHVRAIAKQEGYAAALATVSFLRNEAGCDREDVSPIWIAIPLEAGWMLAGGLTRKAIYEETDELSDEDLTLLRRFTDAKVPFADYGHLMLLEFDEIIQRYPRSYVRELAVLGKAEFAGTPNEAITAAEAYLMQYPNSVRRWTALKILTENLLQVGAVARVNQILTEIGGRSDRESDAEVDLPNGLQTWLTVLKQRRRYIAELLDLGDLNAAAGAIRDLADEFAQYSALHVGLDLEALRACELEVRRSDYELESCSTDQVGPRVVGLYEEEISERIAGKELASPDALRRASEFVSTVSAGLGTEATDERKFAIALAVRDCIQRMEPAPDIDLCDDFTGTMPRSVQRALLTAVFRSCLKTCGEEFGSRAMYLWGSYLRNRSRYEESFAAFRSLADKFPRSALTDDALAELGWFYLYVQRDTGAAQSMLTRVVREFPDRNAYDNALNWLAVLHLENGEFGASLAYTIRVVQTALSERLREAANARWSELAELGDSVSRGTLSSTVTFCAGPDSSFSDEESDWSVRICAVARDSPAWRVGVREGMKIARAGEKWVSSVFELAQVLRDDKPSEIELEYYDPEAVYLRNLGVSPGDLGVDMQRFESP